MKAQGMDQRTYEALRGAAATIAIAVVAAAGIVGHSLPETPKMPVYEGFVLQGKLVRLDTRTGDVVACDLDHCERLPGKGRLRQMNGASEGPRLGEALGQLIRSAVRSVTALHVGGGHT